MTPLEKADVKNIWHPFSPLTGAAPIVIKKARGVWLETHDGRRILDAISSWWVNIHGHAHPKIAAAIARQAHRLEQVIFAGFTHKPAIKLSEKLLGILPSGFTKIFFSDDGSTSTEVALKLAIQYWHNKGISRKKILAIEGAYHGDTFGAMSVGSRGIFNHPFDDFLFQVTFIPFPEGNGQNSIDAMKELANEDYAAFIYEPLVQGAAGMRMYEPETLEQLLRLAKKQGIICIADEVMTGFGRTGKKFASDYMDTKPDMMCLSKGLTGGFLPMGLTVVNQQVEDAFSSPELAQTFFHGHSYTANPMACAAANASMKLLLKKSTLARIQQIETKHRAFVDTLPSTSHILNVRMRGTILALELVADDKGYGSRFKERIYNYFLKKDILLRPLGNVLYLLPPYVISDEELNMIYDSIHSFLKELSIKKKG